MYGIFTYIWVNFRTHVGKYSIHGAYDLFHYWAVDNFRWPFWAPRASWSHTEIASSTTWGSGAIWLGFSRSPIDTSNTFGIFWIIFPTHLIACFLWITCHAQSTFHKGFEFSDMTDATTGFCPRMTTQTGSLTTERSFIRFWFYNMFIQCGAPNLLSWFITFCNYTNRIFI